MKIQSADVAIVGAGAAGLATAIFTARKCPDRLIVALDGASRLGAKMLMSGGGRCNVTNRHVTADDYWGGNRHQIKKVLSAFTVERTVDFFCEIGVALHEEENGKLFPDSHDARTVVEALVREAQRCGVRIDAGTRVTDIARTVEDFRMTTSAGILSADRVVLATGGLSFPKTGSDGGGYLLARQLGHSLVPTTPALVPLELEGDFHSALAGITQSVELTFKSQGGKPIRMSGSLLWTHGGISGPVVLDLSRHWHRAQIEGRAGSLSINFFPGHDFTSLEQQLMESASSHPKIFLNNTLARHLPARVAEAVLGRLSIKGRIPLGQLGREVRRKLVRSLLDWPLSVRGSGGYGQAEVTAGGVNLNEIDPSWMTSRVCPNLFLAGEILDVDGRIGGFNFQWAWASAWGVAQGIQRSFSCC